MSVFSIFTTKKRRQPKKAQPTPTEYYAHLATRLSVLKVALLAVLVCFIAFGFTFYGSELTMENFRYMMKFMSVDRDTTLAAGNTITYDSDEDTIYAILNGDVAIVNRNGLSV